MIRGIGQIAVNVEDVDRAVGFYRDVLGLELLFEVSGMAFFDCGGVRLMLSPPSKPEFDHPASILYYRVDDARTAADTLRGRGVSFEQEPALVHRTDEHELWMAFFRDPDDNVLALMSEIPLEGKA